MMPAYSAGFLRSFFHALRSRSRPSIGIICICTTPATACRAAFDAVARTADLFINVSGVSFLPDALSPHCLKFLSIPIPATTRSCSANVRPGPKMSSVGASGVLAHDRHFTYGENFGAPDCRVPTAGLRWRKTRMPIVLDLWEGIPDPDFAERRVEHGDDLERVPRKARISAVPNITARRPNSIRSSACRGRLGLPFRLALGGTEAPTAQLASGRLGSSGRACRTLTPRDYRDYIAASRGEVSVAKNVYVALRTAWFSCRSACYLAAARPVVVQDTGFSRVFPTGRGLHTFTTAEASGRGDPCDRARLRDVRRASQESWRTPISTRGRF